MKNHELREVVLQSKNLRNIKLQITSKTTREVIRILIKNQNQGIKVVKIYRLPQKVSKLIELELDGELVISSIFWSDRLISSLKAGIACLAQN